MGCTHQGQGNVESPLLNLSNVAVLAVEGPGGGWWPTI